jgi:integrase
VFTLRFSSSSHTVKKIRQHLGTRTSGRVFQTRNGKRINTESVLDEQLYSLLDRLKIPRGGMHAFRHGHVSHLQANNAPCDFVKAQIGHSSLATTSGYTHFPESFKREIVERLASQLTLCTQVGNLYPTEIDVNAV